LYTAAVFSLDIYGTAMVIILMSDVDALSTHTHALPSSSTVDITVYGYRE
jgi:hypothetical protein